VSALLRLARPARLALASALAALLTAAPEVASACAVCSNGNNAQTQRGFVIGSIFLSVLPPAFVGTVVYVIWRRAKKIAAEEAAGVVRLPERARV
jgi:Ca2+/Na+ antiporter